MTNYDRASIAKHKIMGFGKYFLAGQPRNLMEGANCHIGPSVG